MSIGLQTLVLSSSFQPVNLFPLSVIPAEEAMIRLTNGSAHSILNYDRPIKTPSRTDLFWPSVIANTKTFSFSKRKVNSIHRLGLLTRDHFRCQYCGTDLNERTVTKDHVLPRSKGGKNDYSNVVAACESCNRKKADNLPLGQFKPKQTPYVPTYQQLLAFRRQQPIVIHDRQWVQFLPAWSGKIYLVSDKGREEITDCDHNSIES